jgi:hypothetical protein
MRKEFYLLLLRIVLLPIRLFIFYISLIYMVLVFFLPSKINKKCLNWWEKNILNKMNKINDI